MQIKGIILDKGTGLPATIKAIGEPKHAFETLEVTNSPLHFLEVLLDTRGIIGFVSDNYSSGEYKSLFDDLINVSKKQQIDPPILFVYTRDVRPHPALLHFHPRLLITNGDRVSNQKAFDIFLRNYIRDQSSSEFIRQLPQMFKSILEIVNSTAEKIKRGYKVSLTTVHESRHLEIKGDQEEFWDTYVEQLIEAVEKKGVPKTISIKVPENIVNKDLPHLSVDRYSGVSDRVWKKLTKKFESESSK